MTTTGELRERVSFEFRAASDDGFGNTQAGDWTHAFPDGSSPSENRSFAARIKPQRGGETIQAARLAGNQPVVMLRDFDVATSARRIVAYRGGRLYRRVLEFHARAIVAAGAGRITAGEEVAKRWRMPASNGFAS
jgi:hypothetical protein